MEILMSYREEINHVVSGCTGYDLVIRSCKPRTTLENSLNPLVLYKPHRLIQSYTVAISLINPCIQFISQLGTHDV